MRPITVIPLAVMLATAIASSASPVGIITFVIFAHE
jgi:hypothetical protein